MEDYVISNILFIQKNKRLNKNVLDIACGTGQYVYSMYNLDFGNIINIDICSHSLNYAKKYM